MDDRASPLSPWWVLGTFHSVALVVALIALVYRGGGLGGLLAGLSTLSGTLLFLALWAIALFTTRRALAGLDWLSDEPKEMRSFYWRALRWGAATGMLFLVALGVVTLANAALTAGERGRLEIGGAFFAVVFFGSFGMVFAAAIGGVVGVTLGALDIAALRVARALTQPQQATRNRE